MDISELTGNITGLKDKEWGHIGVNNIPSTFVLTRGPPAAKLYAVEPVGVDTRRLRGKMKPTRQLAPLLNLRHQFDS